MEGEVTTESTVAGRRPVVFMGTIASEKSCNTVGKDGRVVAFSVTSDLCGGVREGRIHDEPVEIS